MTQPSSQPRPSLLLQTLVCSGCFALAWNNQPFVFDNGQIHWLATGCAIAGSVMALSILTRSLYSAARFLDWVGLHQPKPNPNSTDWAKFKEIKPLLAKGRAPFWGVPADKPKVPLFIDFESSALCIAPAGSGKGIFTVIPNLCALAGKYSKLGIDLKGELAVMMIEHLRRCGEQVYTLNPSNKFIDIVGESHCLNPLDVIVEDLFTPNQLTFVMEDLVEFSSLLIPETRGETDPFWPLGAKSILTLATLIECMIEGYDASITQVSLLVVDRLRLQQHLCWIVGTSPNGEPLSDGAMPIEQSEWAGQHDPQKIHDFIADVRASASAMLQLIGAKDSKLFESFATQARQAMRAFGFGSLTEVTRKSTIPLKELKNPDKASTLFIMLDETRMETSKKYVELVQWQIVTMMKRHPYKHVPVYFFLDEATNYKIPDLPFLMTGGRGYGFRLFIIIQVYSEFRRVYGNEAAETLISETQIKQILPGQRSPEVLELISKLLGQKAVVSVNQSQGQGEDGVKDSFSQAEKPLMSPSAIRQSETGVLLVKGEKSIEIIPVSYGEIHPWRRQVGINPFHKKPFLKKIKLKIKR